MKGTFKQQKGIALVTILIAIVAIGAVSGVGYVVYKNSQKDPASSTGQNADVIDSFAECAAAGNPIMESFPEQCTANGKTFTDPAQSVTKPALEEDSWFLYESPGKEFTVRLADGWEMERYQKSSSIYQADNDKLALKTGTKAKITEVDGGKDFVYGLSINYADQNTDQVFTQGQQQASLKTKDGFEVQKFYNVVNEDSETIGPSKGTVEYYYVIRPDAKQVITVFYGVFPGEIDHHEVIEKSVLTAHFNK